MTLGELMKTYRIETEMTQKMLAEELGIPGSDADVCRLENGTKRTLDALRARFIVYCCSGKYRYCKKENAETMLIEVSDLKEEEKKYLVAIILT